MAIKSKKIHAALIVAAVALYGCTGKEGQDQGAAVPIAALETVKAVDVRSAHAPKVEAALYPEVKPVSGIAFAWNFGKSGVSVYELTQTIESAIGSSAENALNRAVTINGKVTVSPMSPTSGAVEFSEMTAAHEMIDDKGQRKKAIGPMQPPKPFRITPDSVGADPMTLLMMPLPGKMMQPGESLSLNLNLPLRAGGAGIPVPAVLTVIYAGDAKRGEKTLSRLDTTITLGDFRPPKDQHGEYAVAVGGTGRAYFDPATGRLFESWTALRFTLDGKQEKHSAPDKKEPPVKEFDSIHMDSDNFFRLKLKE